MRADDAAELLAHYGPNVVEGEPPHLVRRLATKLTGPVPFMLEAAVVLEVAAGKSTEAAIVAALVVFNAMVSLLQEGRARHALQLLRSRLAVQARVLRDGRWQRIPAAALVPGDVVHIRIGDIVPADLDALDGAASVDQSVLTGESNDVAVTPGGVLYAGSLVRRGEMTGEVTATGSRTYFGRTAELVRTATTQTHLAQTILRVVWALLVMDGALVLAIVAYGLVARMPMAELLPFVLILVIATVPVALPATFTLATSLGALDLARSGVLVTHLSAIEEAAAMDLLCADKTGTITENRLTVTAVRPYGGRTNGAVLALAAAASDEATQDPIDLAIIAAADATAVTEMGSRRAFIPFDPHTKRSEARIDSGSTELHVLKGSPAVLSGVAACPRDFDDDVGALAATGTRVLAVALGAPTPQVVGLVGLGDPLRADSTALVEHLHGLGVRVVLVSGDSAPTARAVARRVGIGDRLASAQDLHARGALDYDVVAGVLPEDKLALVEHAQRSGHVVGMTGDGVNDAPALKRAEVGVAVSAATDVAKEAASIVLTDAGLGGIVRAIETGRAVYQRMLTYTLNKIAKTFQVSLFLGIGLLATGNFVTTPRLVLLLLFANDFVTMSIASDRVGFSAAPDRWRVRAIASAALAVALPWLAGSFATYIVARDVLGLDLARTQTLVFVMLVLTGQATVYLVRDRRHLWASRPSTPMLIATVLDLVVVGILAVGGVLMAPVPLSDIAALFGAVAVLTVVFDLLKSPLLDGIRAVVATQAG